MSFTGMTNLAYDTFEPGINGQIEYEASIYSLFTRTTKGVEGRTARIKLATGDGGVGNIQEGGAFPAAVDPRTDEASITLSEIATTIEFTSKEIALLNSRSAAAVEVIEYKMTNIKDVVKRDIIRQGWSNGSATLARCSAAAGVNVVPIQSTTTNQIDRDRGLWLYPDRFVVDFVDSVTGTAIANGTSRVVSAVDFTSGASTVTVTGAANLTPTATTVIVRAGNVLGGGTYTSLEMPGLQSAIDNANTYLGVNRATASNLYWRSVVLGNSGTLRALTMPLIHQLRTEISKQGNQPLAPDYCFLANQGVFHAYGELLVPQMRFMAPSGSGTRSLDGGWASLEIFGADLLMDIHCPRNTLFGVYKPGIEWRVAKNARNNVFQFWDPDGSIFRTKTATTGSGYAAAIQANLDGFMALVSPRPNKHGRLNDLAEVGVVN